MSLADEIIDAANKSEAGRIEDLPIEEYPNRFFEVHPSTYKRDEYIICDNEVLTPDTKLLTRLLDHPLARLNYAKTCWLFERIKEMAPPLNDRFIVVSEQYMWDRVEARLLPRPLRAKTTNNKTTRRRLKNE